MNAIDQDDGLSACTAEEMPQLVVALEHYQEALRAGRPVDRDAFLAEHPEVAGRLAEYIEALELIQSVAGETTSDCGPMTIPSPLASGDILSEFRIVREIGRGGMGVVYEAEQLGLSGRRVALKVMPVSSTVDARTLQRFRVETQAAACLNHPSIVPVFSAGLDNGIPFYAMPLITGRSLAEVLRTLRGDGEALPLSLTAAGVANDPEVPWHVVVARLGLQAAEALEHAHSLGVIHRDIKPSNLIVDAEWRLWVTDFGLARMTCNETGPTSTGDLVGTLRYMTPEQIRGEPSAGRAGRYLCVGGDALRGPHAAPPVRGMRSLGPHRSDPQPRTASASVRRADGPEGPGDDRPEGDGQAPDRPVREGTRPGRRPPPVPRRSPNPARVDWASWNVHVAGRSGIGPCWRRPSRGSSSRWYRHLSRSGGRSGRSEANLER